MRIPRNSFLLAFCLLITISSSPLFGQDVKVDINQLINETQFVSEEPDDMKLVWYIPVEYWQAALGEDPSVSKQEINEIVNTLKKYEIFAIVDAKIGVFGSMTYKDRSQVRSEMKLTDIHGRTINALDESEIDQDTNMLLSVMKPMLSNMLGGIGENLHFFCFNARQGSKRIAMPTKEGTMTMEVSGEDFKFEMPFASLIPKKYCPVDGKALNGTWTYCPFHGKALTEKN